MDVQKEKALVGWLRGLLDVALRPDNTLRGLDYGACFIGILQFMDSTATLEEFPTSKERVCLTEKFLEDFYSISFHDARLVNFHILASEDALEGKDLEVAKVLLLLLCAGIQDKNSDIVSAAMHADPTLHWDIRLLIESVVRPDEPTIVLPSDFAQVFFDRSEPGANNNAVSFCRLVNSSISLDATANSSSRFMSLSEIRDSPLRLRIANLNLSLFNDSASVASPSRPTGSVSPATPLEEFVNSPQLAKKIMRREKEHRYKLERQLKDKEETVRRLQHLLRQETALRDELELDLQEASTILARKDCKISELEKQVQRMRSYQDRLDELGALESCQMAMERDMESLRDKALRAETMKQYCQTLKEENGSLYEQLCSLQDKVGGLEQAQMEVTRTKMVAHRLQVRVSELEGQVGALQEGRDKVVQERLLLEADLEVLRDLNHQQRQQLLEKSTSNGDISSVGESMAVVTDKMLEEVRLELDMMRTTWFPPDVHQTLVHQLQDALSTLQQQQEESERLRQLLQQTRKDLIDVKSELTSKDMNILSLEDKVKNDAQHYLGQQEHYSQLLLQSQTDLEDLKTKLHKQELDYQHLQNLLKEQAENHHEDCDRLKQCLEQSRLDLESLKTELNSKECHLKYLLNQSRQDVEQHKKECKTVRELLQQTCQDSQRLQDQVKKEADQQKDNCERLTQLLQQSQEQLVTFKSNLCSREAECTRVQERVEQNEMECEQLKNSLQQTQKQCEDLKETLSRKEFESQQREKRLQQEVDQYKDDCERLIQCLEQSQLECQRLQDKLRQEVEEHKENSERYIGTVQKCQQDLLNLKAEVNSRDSDCEHLQGLVHQEENRLGVLQSTHSALQQQYAEQEERCQNIQAELTSKTALCQELQSSLDLKSQHCESLQESVASLEQQNMALIRDLKTQQEELKHVHSEMTDKSAQIERLTAEVGVNLAVCQQLAADRNTQQQEQVAATVNLKKMSERCQELERLLTDKDCAIELLTQKTALNLAEVAEVRKKLELSLQDNVQCSDALKQFCQTLQDENKEIENKLSTTVEEKKALRHLLHQSQKDLLALKSELSSREVDCAHAKEVMKQEAHEHSQECEQLNQEAREHSQECERLKLEAHEHSQECERLKQEAREHSQECEQLKQEAREHSQECEQLKQEAHEHSQECERLKQEAHEHSQECERLKQEAHEHSQECERLKLEAREHSQECERLKQEAHEHRQECERLGKCLQQTRQECEELKAALSSKELESSLQDHVKQEADKHKKECERLTQCLQQAQLDTQCLQVELRQEVEQLQGKCERLTQVTQQSYKDFLDLKSKYSIKEEECNCLEDKFKTEARHHQEECAKLQQLLLQSQRDVADLKSELDSKENDCRHLQDRAQQAAEEIDKMKQLVQQSDKDQIDLKEDLSSKVLLCLQFQELVKKERELKEMVEHEAKEQKEECERLSAIVLQTHKHLADLKSDFSSKESDYQHKGDQLKLETKQHLEEGQRLKQLLLNSQKDVEDLKSELSRKETENSHDKDLIKQDAEQHLNECERLGHLLQQSQKDVQELKSELDSKESKSQCLLDRAKQQIEQHKKECETLTELLQQNQQDSQSVQDNVKEEAAGHREKYERLTQLLQQSQEELLTLKSELSKKEVEREQFEQLLQQARKECEDLISALNCKELESHHQKDLIKHREEQHKEEYEKVKSCLQQTEVKCQHLDSQVKQESYQHKEECERLKYLLRQSEMKSQHLQNDLQEADHYKEECERLAELSHKLQKDLLNIKAEMGIRDADCEHLQGLVHQEENRLGVLQSTHSALQQQYAEQEERCQNIQAELTSKTALCQELQSSLDLKSQHCESLQESVASLEQQNMALIRDLKTQQEELKHVHSEMTDKSAQIERLTAEVGVHLAVCQQLAADRDTQQQEVALMKETLDRTTLLHKQQLAAYSSLQQHHALLKDQYREVQTQLLSQSNQCHELFSRLQQETTSTQVRQADLEKARSELTEKENLITQLTSQLRVTLAKCQQLTSDKDSVQQESAELKENLEKAHLRYQQLEQQALMGDVQGQMWTREPAADTAHAGLGTQAEQRLMLTPGAAEHQMLLALDHDSSGKSCDSRQSIYSLASVKSSGFVPSGAGKMFHCDEEPPESPKFEWGRLNELQRRNTLCLPHMKSSYPIETQTVSDVLFPDEVQQSCSSDVYNKPPPATSSASTRKRKPDTVDFSGGLVQTKDYSIKQARQGNAGHPPTVSSKSIRQAATATSEDKRTTLRRSPRLHSTTGRHALAKILVQDPRRESIAFDVGFSPVKSSGLRGLTRQKAFISKGKLSREDSNSMPAPTVVCSVTGPCSDQATSKSSGTKAQRKPLGTHNFLQTQL